MDNKIETWLYDIEQAIFEKIEDFPRQEQEEIARLILEELSWDQTFDNTQEQLTNLGREAN